MTLNLENVKNKNLYLHPHRCRGCRDSGLGSSLASLKLCKEVIKCHLEKYRPADVSSGGRFVGR